MGKGGRIAVDVAGELTIDGADANRPLRTVSRAVSWPRLPGKARGVMSTSRPEACGWPSSGRSPARRRGNGAGGSVDVAASALPIDGAGAPIVLPERHPAATPGRHRCRRGRIMPGRRRDPQHDGRNRHRRVGRGNVAGCSCSTAPAARHAYRGLGDRDAVRAGRERHRHGRQPDDRGWGGDRQLDGRSRQRRDSRCVAGSSAVGLIAQRADGTPSEIRRRRRPAAMPARSTVSAAQITLAAGAQIASTTAGTGAGGPVDVTARRTLLLDGAGSRHADRRLGDGAAIRAGR